MHMELVLCIHRSNTVNQENRFKKQICVCVNYKQSLCHCSPNNIVYQVLPQHPQCIGIVRSCRGGVGYVQMTHHHLGRGGSWKQSPLNTRDKCPCQRSGEEKNAKY